MALQSPPYGIGRWVYDATQVVEDPGAGIWRLVGTETDATFAISQTDNLAGDQAALLGQVLEGDRLLVQRIRDALRYLVVDVGTPIDQGDWWELPVVDVLQWLDPVPAFEFAFVFRHVAGAADPSTSAPAPLVPIYELETLVADLVAALVAEVKADATRDATKLDRAARAAIRDVEIHLDYPSDGDYPAVYATADTVDPHVFDALVVDGAAYLKRVGLAYGVVGYDEADPLAARARGAALAGITTGHKARWGVA